MKPTPAAKPAIAAGASKRACAVGPLPSASEPDLDDHLQDGAGADRQRQRRPLRRIGKAADPQADDGRAAGQQRQRRRRSTAAAAAFRIGAAMPMPSVMLCSVKPSTRKVPSPAAPAAKAAPIASPSPRLCRPMPSAMKVASASPVGAPLAAARPPSAAGSSPRRQAPPWPAPGTAPRPRRPARAHPRARRRAGRRAGRRSAPAGSSCRLRPTPRSAG